MLDSSKSLLASTLKHASTYGNGKAQDFLADYAKASEKHASSRKQIEETLYRLRH
jgi:hypothetical protein